jgi:hypothetical protein
VDRCRSADGHALGVLTNADGTHGLPMPTVALVDRDGIVRRIDVHPDDVLRAADAHSLSAPA